MEDIWNVRRNYVEYIIMQLPTVSVIITTRNRPLLLGGAMQSVLSQDYTHFELLVIDDASSGNETEHITSSFHDGRIRYIKHEINRGSTASLNTGLNEARGIYIAILDDDDEWITKDKLSKQIAFLESHPEHLLVGTNVIVVHYDSNKEIARSRALQNDEGIRKSFLLNNPIAHSSVIYRKKSVLSVGGYNPLLARGKDYDLWLKLAQRGKIAILPDYTVKYRESSFNQRNVIKMKLKDTRVKMEIVWRYRSVYPSFIKAITIECSRLIIFSILNIFSPLVGRFLK